MRFGHHQKIETPKILKYPHVPTPEIINPAIKKALAKLLGIDEKDVPLK